jgi:hypothetical protein
MPPAPIPRSSPSPAHHLSRLDHSWRDLADSYAGLTKDELLLPGVAGSWSIKDILAHISTWELEALHHLPAVAAGLRLPRYSALGGIDAFNARASAAQARLSLTQVLSQLDSTHRRLLDYLLSATPPPSSRPRFLRRLRLDTWDHYRLHADSIRSHRAHFHDP